MSLKLYVMKIEKNMIFRIFQVGSPLKSLNKQLEYLEKPKIGYLKLKITSKE